MRELEPKFQNARTGTRTEMVFVENFLPAVVLLKFFFDKINNKKKCSIKKNTEKFSWNFHENRTGTFIFFLIVWVWEKTRAHATTIFLFSSRTLQHDEYQSHDDLICTRLLKVLTDDWFPPAGRTPGGFSAQK